MANELNDRSVAALQAFERLVANDRPGSPEDKYRKRENLKRTPYGKDDSLLPDSWLEGRPHRVFWLRHFIDG